MGLDLHGKVLGLFGMGRIARAVARRAQLGFGMELLYTSRSASPVLDGLAAERVDLAGLLERSDVLSLHAPLTGQTRGVIGSKELAAMKPTAILVNTARGPLVDEEALVTALDHGRPWAAALDVFAEEPHVHPRLLARHERVVLAPHVGSATVEARRKMASLAASNAHAVLTGGEPLTPVSD
jgi:glyoxylate reductase